MLDGLRGRVAIAGMGLAAVGEAEPHREILELSAEVAFKAVSDAGLTIQDVDGIFGAQTHNPFYTVSLSEYLGIRPRFVDGTMIGGSAFESHCIHAALALRAGLCNVALICYASTQRTGAIKRGKTINAAGTDPHVDPYSPRLPVTAYALAAARHMHEYGTTRRQLASVAVAARQWAQLNPQAFARDPLSIEDVLNSRMVSDPLTVRDCCLVTDGAGALVMVRADRARNLAQKPVYFLGGGTSLSHSNIACMADLTVTPALNSGRDAYEMAKVAPKDIDVLALYDAFTINTILFLEDLGFCKKGEGGAFVESGAIAPGGSLAVNTNGGGLSCLHPGMYGMFLQIEAVEQLRGAAGARQVKDVDVALCHGNGGILSTESTTIWGTEAAL
ncbi:MAG: acetyl-CoA acetyltransferase [Parvibaculum sp.]|uniref:acetyl-CoA acetyltransferase n=1 Tax=Parvibaculum sp. TaxID=2024848 RepID=UPI003C7866E4